jgi:hypothetical protein
MSPNDVWLSSLRIASLMRRSPLIPCSASVNAATIVVGASGFAAVLDHAHDVARQHRFVHRLGIDQRQFPRVDGREVGLGKPFSADALVDELAEVAFEVGHQVGALAGQRLACIEKNRLILAHVRALGARHQKVSDAVEHRRERQLQTMDREIPAIAEYPGHVSGHRAPGGPVAGGRCHAHAFGPRWPCTASQLTSGRPVASQR